MRFRTLTLTAGALASVRHLKAHPELRVQHQERAATLKARFAAAGTALAGLSHELGFAAEEGLSLDLVRQTAWAQSRDMLGAGLVDAAHMLAPMAVARAMGLQASLPPVEVLMVLSHGGQVIGTSTALARDLPPLTGAAQAADAIRSARSRSPRSTAEATNGTTTAASAPPAVTS